MDIDKEFIETKIRLALAHLEHLEKQKFDVESLKNNVSVYSTVFYLYQNVIERCLGISTYIAKVKGLDIPRSASGVFMSLAKANIIDKRTAARLGGAYGFRNAIVHDYDEFDYKGLVKEHSQNLANLRSFLKQIDDFVERIK